MRVSSSSSSSSSSVEDAQRLLQDTSGEDVVDSSDEEAAPPPPSPPATAVCSGTHGCGESFPINQPGADFRFSKLCATCHRSASSGAQYYFYIHCFSFFLALIQVFLLRVVGGGAGGVNEKDKRDKISKVGDEEVLAAGNDEVLVAGNDEEEKNGGTEEEEAEREEVEEREDAEREEVEEREEAEREEEDEDVEAPATDCGRLMGTILANVRDVSGGRYDVRINGGFDEDEADEDANQLVFVEVGQLLFVIY